jgi:hypothetical protein
MSLFDAAYCVNQDAVMVRLMKPSGVGVAVMISHQEMMKNRSTAARLRLLGARLESAHA